jgi:hypothetical protein
MVTHVRSLIVFSLAVGSGALFFASVFPIWTNWYINPWESVGHRVALWTVFWECVTAQFQTPNPAFPVTCTGDLRDLLIAAVIFSAGCVAGALVAGAWLLNRFLHFTKPTRY